MSIYMGLRDQQGRELTAPGYERAIVTPPLLARVMRVRGDFKVGLRKWPPIYSAFLADDDGFWCDVFLDPASVGYVPPRNVWICVAARIRFKP